MTAIVTIVSTTAKRLGAVVSAFDVRPVVKEQVESLGAKFIEVPAEELAAREGPGYVTEATGYLANFRQDVQPMSTGGVLLPPQH